MGPPVKEPPYLRPMLSDNNTSSQGRGRASPPNPPRPLTQTTLLGVPLAASDSETFGHAFPSRPATNASLITFQNIGPQPRSPGPKFHVNPRRFSRYNVSICLLAEHCLTESRLSHFERFTTRFKVINPSSFPFLANYVHASAAPWNLTGGTGFAAHHYLLAHKHSHGSNPTGLGCWVYICLAGRNGCTVTFYVVYRPCRNTSTIGSVWNQHISYFMSQGISEPDPGALFDSQFLDAVRSSLEAGDNVVIGVDNNADVRSSTLANELHALGLVDAILTQHAPASPPATHNHNHNRTPIDSIWVTLGLTVLWSGYAPFDAPCAMLSNHRLLWVELNNSSLMGKHLPSVAPVKACCIR